AAVTSSETSAAGRTGHHVAVAVLSGRIGKPLPPVRAAATASELLNCLIKRMTTAGAIGRIVREVMDQFIIVAKKNVPNTQRLSSSESAVFCWTRSAAASVRIPTPIVANKAPSTVTARTSVLEVSPRPTQR